MSRAPSRQALRYLTRLCHKIDRVASTGISSSTSKNIPICRHQLPTLALSRNLTPQRQFSTTPPSNAEPVKPGRQDPDPQNQSSPKLPDITTYYTLFPSTLPNGPPRAPSSTPKIQTSSTPTGKSTRAGPNQTQNPAEGEIAEVEVENQPNEAPHQDSQFEIHLPSLRKEFLKLQSTHHPDKYPTSTPAHQKALALSSLINNAYKTLSDPLLRAQYLLQLQYDIDVTSEDNAAHPTDQETLMEVMDAQERVEDAKTQDEVDDLRKENQVRIQDTVLKIGNAFDRSDADGAKKETVRLKYWRSLQQGLDDWEPGKEVRLIH